MALEQDIKIALIALGLSFLLSLLFAALFRVRKLRDKDLNKKRAAHSQPTSQLGGVAALIATQCALLTSESGFDLVLLSVLLPVFAIGLREDLGRTSSPQLRLVVAAASALMFIGLEGIWLENVNFLLLDVLLTFQWLAVLFTACCLVGITNAINFIDGINGLASGKIIMVSGATVWLASSYGEVQLYLISVSVFAATLGLFLLNFPVGRIFMGDAGAYSFGLLIGICLVTLKVRHPEISGWGILLIVFWPITDTLHSIWRRRRANKSSYRPDMMHMHHLVMRSLDIALGSRMYRQYTNPLATAIILPLAAAPVLTGVIFHESGADLVAAVLMYMFLFWGSYAGLATLARSGWLRGRFKPARRKFSQLL